MALFRTTVRTKFIATANLKSKQQAWNGKQQMPITCYIEMSIAGGFANFVRDDAFIDTTMCMSHRADDQAVDITDCRRKAESKYQAHQSISIFSLAYFQ